MSSGTRSRSLSARSATALRDNAPFRSACASRGVLWRSAFPCLNRSVRELEAGVIGRSSHEGHDNFARLQQDNNFAQQDNNLARQSAGRWDRAKPFFVRFWIYSAILGVISEMPF